MRKLYIFNNGGCPGLYNCYSMTDKGMVLGSHACSNDDFMYQDLYGRPARKEFIDKHFNGEPYEVEIVFSGTEESNPAFMEAIRLNQLAGEEAKKKFSVEVWNPDELTIPDSD